LSPHSDALELPHPDLTDGWILLRAWDSADAAELVDAVPEPDPGNAGLPRWGSAEEARDWIVRQRTRLTERVGYSFAIVSCETGAVQGFVGLWLRPDASAAFGYWILPHARRRGLATHAVGLVARWAHDELGITILEIAAEPGNTGSIRVAERSGFDLVGPVTGYRDASGGIHDVLLYRRDR
jgi:RimJ/RimL family protein N-acetyltransferase